MNRSSSEFKTDHFAPCENLLSLDDHILVRQWNKYTSQTDNYPNFMSPYLAVNFLWVRNCISFKFVYFGSFVQKKQT
jgi:hypothetical protein